MGEVTDFVNDAKAWWQSKTIIGTLLMIIPVILKIIFPDVEIDLEGAVDEVWMGADGLAEYADSIYAQIQTVLGFVLAVYGRIKAKVGIR